MSAHPRRRSHAGLGPLLAGRQPWTPTIAASLVLLSLVGTIAFATYTQLDLDGDGLKTTAEWRLDTDPTRIDTDGDSLGDGWELVRTLDPLRPDSDADGLLDAQELDWRLNPLSPDTDLDGMPDDLEALEGPRDCDGDGYLNPADADDDADQRLDADEIPEQRCDPDVDNDTILDGLERALPCIVRPDCDYDGLSDALENGSAFDPLNPDTFSLGLRDSVPYAFQQAGQPPSRDEDDDGIPDAWETATGLIDWGPFQPRPNQTDLLVEYVRILGPDSGRYATLPLEPVYERVADVFLREGNVRLQYVETRLSWPTEPRPPLLPTHSAAYYRAVLEGSQSADNPYVTTVVMNPQHDQADILHLGVAPIRGMLAAVDVGSHTEVTFANTTRARLSISPFWESVLEADRQDVIQASRDFQSGGRNPNGTFFLRLKAPFEDIRLVWTPLWFRTPPALLTDDGEWIPLREETRRFDVDRLAQTTLHELGHTLGLCHTELSACYANLTTVDQLAYRTSTMYSSAPSGTLHFLPSEWATIHAYQTCVPEQPVVLVAQTAPPTEVLRSKYQYSLANATQADIRACRDYSSIPEDLTPAPDTFHYDLAPDLQDAPRYVNSTQASWVFAAASLGASLAIATLPLAAKLSRTRRADR